MQPQHLPQDLVPKVINYYIQSMLVLSNKLVDTFCCLKAACSLKPMFLFYSCRQEKLLKTSLLLKTRLLKTNCTWQISIFDWFLTGKADNSHFRRTQFSDPKMGHGDHLYRTKSHDPFCSHLKRTNGSQKIQKYFLILRQHKEIALNKFYKWT